MCGNLGKRLAIVCVIMCVCLAGCNANQYSQSETKSQEIRSAEAIGLDYEELSVTKDHMLEIHDVHDGKVFCSMIDNDFGHGVFMVTDQLVIYDTEQSKAEIINYPIEERIIDYDILDNNIYYVVVSSYDELTNNKECISWTLKRSDLDFSNSITLLSGEITNPTTTPEIIRAGDICYLAWIDTSSGEIKSGFSEIRPNECYVIYSADSGQEHIIDLYRVIITPDYLLFKVRKNNEADFVKMVNLHTKEEDYLFSCDLSNTEEYLFGFAKAKEFLYITTKMEEGCRVYIINENETKQYEFEFTLTSEKLLNSSVVISSHNGEYYFFDKKGLYRTVQCDIPNITHHFYCLNENEIILQDYDGKLFMLSTH